MGANTHDMSVRMGFGISGGGQRDCRLYIEDRESGTMIFEATIDATQFMAMMGGGSADVLAWFTPHPERVGREHQHGQLLLDAYEIKKDAAELAAAQWCAENGWETWEIRRDNQGHWVITGRRWVAKSTKEQQ